jgi:hypothetical protein
MAKGGNDDGKQQKLSWLLGGMSDCLRAKALFETAEKALVRLRYN